MTTPEERTRAVLGLAESVRALRQYAYGTGTPNALVPRELIQHLQDWLRHYPTRTDLWIAAREAPSMFGEPKP